MHSLIMFFLICAVTSSLAHHGIVSAFWKRKLKLKDLPKVILLISFDLEVKGSLSVLFQGFPAERRADGVLTGAGCGPAHSSSTPTL